MFLLLSSSIRDCTFCSPEFRFHIPPHDGFYTTSISHPPVLWWHKCHKARGCSGTELSCASSTHRTARSPCEKCSYQFWSFIKELYLFSWSHCLCAPAFPDNFNILSFSWTGMSDVTHVQGPCKAVTLIFVRRQHDTETCNDMYCKAGLKL